MTIGLICYFVSYFSIVVGCLLEDPQPATAVVVALKGLLKEDADARKNEMADAIVAAFKKQKEEEEQDEQLCLLLLWEQLLGWVRIMSPMSLTPYLADCKPESLAYSPDSPSLSDRLSLDSSDGPNRALRRRHVGQPAK